MGENNRWAQFMSADVNYEVQRTNQYSVRINNLQNDQEVELAVDNVTVPDLSISPIELAHGNTKVKVAGDVTIGQVTLGVKDFILPDLQGVIYDWMNDVYEYTSGKVGWAQHYKKDGLLVLYSPDWSVNRSWTLTGMWPSTVTWGSFTYEGGDKLLIEMTLEIDKFYRDPISGSPGNQPDSYISPGGKVE